MTCEEENQALQEAMEEYVRIENGLRSILPASITPISQTEDITPTVLTQEMLDRWRELDKMRGPARDKWLDKAQEYVDCRKASGH